MMRVILKVLRVHVVERRKDLSQQPVLTKVSALSTLKEGFRKSEAIYCANQRPSSIRPSETEYVFCQKIKPLNIFNVFYKKAFDQPDAQNICSTPSSGSPLTDSSF